RVLAPPEPRVPYPRLVHHVGTEHLHQRREIVAAPSVRLDRGGGMPRRSACVSRIVRVEAVELVPAYAQSRLRRGLIIEMQSSLLFGIGADLVEVEARIRTRVAEGLRLPF